jgi:hypothetical protein
MRENRWCGEDSARYWRSDGIPNVRYSSSSLPALLVVLLVMTTIGMRVLQSRVERPDSSHVSASCQRQVADQTTGDAFRQTAGACER